MGLPSQPPRRRGRSSRQDPLRISDLRGAVDESGLADRPRWRPEFLKGIAVHVGLPDFYSTYALPILAALLLGALYPVARHITDARQKREYLLLQLITFVSAVAGAKLAFLFGEYGWPVRPVDDWRAVLFSGRSIVGALIFGLLGAEITKPFVRYS